MNTMQCDGWWEQRGLGRKTMDNLRLTFDNGRVWGQGIDVIGPFMLRGQLDGEKAMLVKQYLGAHRVDYLGSFDGEGTLQGQWSIDAIGGRWMIRVVKRSDEINGEHQGQHEQRREDLPIRDWPA